MQVSRRVFMTMTAMAAAAAGTGAQPQPGPLTPGGYHESFFMRSKSSARLGLLDLRARDSEAAWAFMGYRDALAQLKVSFNEIDRLPAAGVRSLVIPAGGLLQPREESALAVVLQAGGTVLLELGPRLTEAAHFKRALDVSRALGLHPRMRVLNLHEGAMGSADARGAASPYIDLRWPIRTKVRHQTFAVPFDGDSGSAVAQACGHVLAVRRRSQSGTLIVLGTPLGPALHCGDCEAREWLRAVWHPAKS